MTPTDPSWGKHISPRLWLPRGSLNGQACVTEAFTATSCNHSPTRWETYCAVVTRDWKRVAIQSEGLWDFISTNARFFQSSHFKFHNKAKLIKNWEHLAGAKKSWCKLKSPILLLVVSVFLGAFWMKVSGKIHMKLCQTDVSALACHLLAGAKLGVYQHP